MKKFMALILSLVMLFSLSTVAFAADDGYFYDISKSKNEDAIEYLYDLGVIEGYGNHKYGPTDTLTRAQACAIIVRAMLSDDKIFADYNDTFTDVNWNEWYRSYVDTAYRNNYMHGYGKGKFGPTDKVTYAQFATIITNILGYDANKLTGEWPTNVLSIADYLKLFNNTSVVDSSANITREDAAQMIYNALNCTVVEYVEDKFVETTLILADIIDTNYTYTTSGTIIYVIQEPNIMNRFITHFLMVDTTGNIVEIYGTCDETVHVDDDVVVVRDHTNDVINITVYHNENIEKMVYVHAEGSHYHYNENCTYLIENINNMTYIPESWAIYFGYTDECGICAMQ